MCLAEAAGFCGKGLQLYAANTMLMSCSVLTMPHFNILSLLCCTVGAMQLQLTDAHTKDPSACLLMIGTFLSMATQSAGHVSGCAQSLSAGA